MATAPRDGVHGRADGADGGPGADAVADLLAGVFARAQARPGATPASALLWSEIARSVFGGKRFRAQIVLATHAGLGGRRGEAAVAVAAAMELLHTAFLVHDDLIDGDSVRRGAPNLSATLRASALAHGADARRADQWATASAVLAGDLALSQAHDLVAGVDAPRPVRDRLRHLLAETVLVSATGELSDSWLGLGLGEPTMAEALAVADAKTAMYSFQAPLRAGAVLADAPEPLLGTLDRVGHHLGRAFQLVDDLEGVFAPEQVSGKSNVSDLREGKRTPLLLHARTLPVWSQIAADVGRHDLSERGAARVRRALAGSAAPWLVADQVRTEVDAALAETRALPAPLEEYVRTLAAGVRRALDRCAGHVEAAR